MTALLTYLIVTAATLGLAGALHLPGRLGPVGRRLAEAAARAPLLDGIIFLLTIAPPLVAMSVAVLLGRSAGVVFGYLVLGVLAQLSALFFWMRLHELAHREAVAGPRIGKTLNRKVGKLANYLAVYWTAWAVPLFFIVRLAQWLLYPPLTWLVRLPRYRSAQWVNVSRHKFDNLVGADRIWCLYCDWMTGVWSLGSEMLRNVESFWCPIRFDSDVKCENCAVDFPDVNQGWIPADGTMAQVADLLDQKYPGPQNQSAWFGHPIRLTVEGQAPDDPPGLATEETARE